MQTNYYFFFMNLTGCHFAINVGKYLSWLIGLGLVCFACRPFISTVNQLNSILFISCLAAKNMTAKPESISGFLSYSFSSSLHSAWTNSREPAMVLGAQEAIADHVCWGRRKPRDFAIFRGDEESWENWTARHSTSMLAPSVRPLSFFYFYLRATFLTMFCPN